MQNRRGMTGLETAIILVAFVITAAAFAFVVLNMGFLTAEKAQSVISSGMAEASSSILMDSGLVGQFDNVTGAQADVALIKLTFYIKLSQGHEPVDLSDDKLVATNSDGDRLLETGEKYKVTVDFNELDRSSLDPAQATPADALVHPYEEFRIELRPALGAVLTIERQLPAVYTTVMVID
jgi:flagellin FlaB